MSLYLVNTHKEGHAYEVLSFDKDTHVAVLRSSEGILTDPNFHIDIVKRSGFILTNVIPDCLKG